MNKEIKQEIKRLVRDGFSEQIAIITACANKGKPELAEEYLEELSYEQDDIKYALEKMGMIPLHEAYKIPLTLFDASYNLIEELQPGLREGLIKIVEEQQLNNGSVPPVVRAADKEESMESITITYEDVEPEPEDKKADDELDEVEAVYSHVLKNGKMYKVQIYPPYI
jgi:hypothetical protein